MTNAAPEWASGCKHCNYGIVNLNEEIYHSLAPLFIAEAMLLKRGELILCTCKAGQTKRAYLSRRLSNIKDAPMLQTKEGLVWAKDTPDDYIPDSWWKATLDLVRNSIPPIRWEGKP